MGGISSAMDALEFILVGASAVQVGTANFLRPDFSFRLAEELPKVAQSMCSSDLEAFRGSLAVS